MQFRKSALIVAFEVPNESNIHDSIFANFCWIDIGVNTFCGGARGK
jgi:hypothetical protein